MSQRFFTLAGATILAAMLASSASAAWHNDEWAIFPPSSNYVPEAGGHLLIVPYYPGYCRLHGHGLLRGRHGCMCGGFGSDWDMVGGSNPGDYGIYTGAPNDEEMLLHLGGNGVYRPSRNVPDFIDMYEGRAP